MVKKEKKINPRRRRGNPGGNPLFKTEDNPGKRQVFSEEPIKIYSIRLPESLFYKLREKTPDIVREILAKAV